MNIGEASRFSGLPAKTIRFYEGIGLLTPARSANGYRQFSARDLHKLTFLGRARKLGFTIEDCRALLQLYEDRQRASADVKRLAEDHKQRIVQKIADLEAMKKTLVHLIDHCQGDNRPDCPILDELAGKQENVDET